MSIMSGRIHADPIPGIRSAGKTIAMGNEGTHACIKHDDNLQN